GGGGGYTVTTLSDSSAPNATYLTDINNLGQVAGYFVDGYRHAFEYESGTFTVANTAGYSAWATAINDSGVVIGNFLGATDNWPYQAGLPEGFSYNAGVFTEINPNPGGMSYAGNA